MSGCCTFIGVGVGAAVATSRNTATSVQQGVEPRTSVGKSMALGAAIGLVLDIALVALTIDSSKLGH